MGANVLLGEPQSGPERIFTMGAPATRPAAARGLESAAAPKAPFPRTTPLVPQISPSRLNRLFYFIPLSSAERRRPSAFGSTLPLRPRAAREREEEGPPFLETNSMTHNWEKN